MICDRNIVCIASSWFDHPTSKHHVMRILAERNRVVWVNYHASRRPEISLRDGRAILRRLRRAVSGARGVSSTIEVLSPLLIPWPECGLARRLNAGRLARRIERSLSRLPARPVQLWLFAPDVPELIDRMPAERVIYYCADDFGAFRGYNTELIEQLERRTMRASDVVITTSAELYESRSRHHPDVHLVPHGVDFDHFAKAVDLSAEQIPEDIGRIRRPILGYIGLVSDYVDLELLRQAAARRPEWSFVLIGDVVCSVDQLRGLKNVHMLGGRPYAELPGYCACLDVGLIPFRMNRLVRAVNPIKLREYLAAGLPVVSAPMSAVMAYRPAVHPAQTLDEFLRACAQALRQRDTEHPRCRQALVRNESWRSRVEQLSEIVLGRAPGASANDRKPVGAPAALATAERSA